VIEAALAFARGYAPLLLLPFTPAAPADSNDEGSMAVDGVATAGTGPSGEHVTPSRLTLRRVELVATTAVFLAEVAARARSAWRALLPELHEALAVRAVLRTVRTYTALLTDLSAAPPPAAAPASAAAPAATTSDGGSGGGTDADPSQLALQRRCVFWHVLAVSDAEKAGGHTVMVVPRKRSLSSGSPQKIGRRVTFDIAGGGRTGSGSLGELLEPIAPALAMAPGLAPAVPAVHTHGHVRRGGQLQVTPFLGPYLAPIWPLSRPLSNAFGLAPLQVTPAFVAAVERALVSALVPLLRCLQAAMPPHPTLTGYLTTAAAAAAAAAGGASASDDAVVATAVTEGSRVFYYSRRYEQRYQRVELLEGLVVAMGPPPAPHTQSPPSTSAPASAAAGAGGVWTVETVLSNGASEWDVSLADVVYADHAPAVAYQRLLPAPPPPPPTPTPTPGAAGAEESKHGAGALWRAAATPDTPRSSSFAASGVGAGGNWVLGDAVWGGRGLDLSGTGGGFYAVTEDERAETAATTAHLLRLVLYATSDTVEAATAGRARGAAAAAAAAEMQALAGAAACAGLRALSHHADAFAPDRAEDCPLVDYLGGRAGLVKQLLCLRDAVVAAGPTGATHKAAWVDQGDWAAFAKGFRHGCDRVVERLTRSTAVHTVEEVEGPAAEAAPVKPKSKLSLKGKLQFVEMPVEEL